MMLFAFDCQIEHKVIFMTKYIQGVYCAPVVLVMVAVVCVRSYTNAQCTPEMFLLDSSTRWEST